MAPIAALIVLVLLTVPAVATAKPPKKPKLVVTALEMQSSPSQSESEAFPSVVLESDKHGRFGLVFEITNRGKARSRKRHAGIYVTGSKIATKAVGPLAAGDSRAIGMTFNPSFVGPGLYDTHVCITNNCSAHVSFSAIPRRWFVDSWSSGPNSVSSSAPFFSSAASNVVFDFFGTINENGEIYFLWLATGSVTGDLTGEADGCTYSGHGEVAHSPWDVVQPGIGYLEIAPQLDSYFAEMTDEERAFTGYQTCPSNPDANVESTQPFATLETIGLDGRVDRPMVSDAKTLSGNYTIPLFNSGRSVGQWSFRADLP